MTDQGGNRERWTRLLSNPQEEVHIEIKGWLDISDGEHKADLAKAMLALANSGGGQILIGYDESDGLWEPDTPARTLLRTTIRMT